jgi:hypothetical protein
MGFEGLLLSASVSAPRGYILKPCLLYIALWNILFSNLLMCVQAIVQCVTHLDDRMRVGCPKL